MSEAHTAPSIPPRERRNEPLLARFARRAVSFTLYALAAVALCTALPALLPVAFLVDVLRRTRFGAVRLLVMLCFYLLCELAGLAAAGALWLVRGQRTEAQRARFVDENYRLQWWWGNALFTMLARIFAFRIELEGLDDLAPGPVLLLVRHVSTADALLPVALLSHPLGLRLRFVLKRELLWDPCLDVVGQRLPNAFVRRGSGDSAREVAEVCSLLQALGPKDVVVLYPEGTRFSPRRHARALASIEAHAPLLAPLAKGLRFCMPPRTGGVLGLLEASGPELDVVCCAHTGFDGIRRLSDLWNGSLVGCVLRIRFWRCPRSAIPEGRDEQARWLYAQWQRVDDWVAAQRARS